MKVTRHTITLALVMASIMAEPGWGRECHGAQVSDKAIKYYPDPLFKEDLMALNDTAWIGVSVHFWYHIISDQIRDTLVWNEKTGWTTIKIDTVSKQYWSIWKEDFYSKYDLRQGPSIQYPRWTASASSQNSPNNNGLFVTGSTIRNIMNECYVEQIHYWGNNGLPIVVFQGKQPKTTLPKSKAFNVKGQTLKAGEKRGKTVAVIPVSPSRNDPSPRNP